MDIISVKKVCLNIKKTEILKSVDISFKKAKFTDSLDETEAVKLCL